MVGERQIHTAVSVGAKGRAELRRVHGGQERQHKGQGQGQAEGLARSLCGWRLLQRPRDPHSLARRELSSKVKDKQELGWQSWDEPSGAAFLPGRRGKIPP